ncbi:MAG: hypothetical protein HY322_09545 [Betaproteobacteria bacterium]|nr:hypothetical protein [Betaproteobacteria bacterium]
MPHVPYKGTGPAVTAVLTGEVTGVPTAEGSNMKLIFFDESKNDGD